MKRDQRLTVVAAGADVATAGDDVINRMQRPWCRPRHALLISRGNPLFLTPGGAAMTTLSQLQKRLAEFEAGEGHAQRQAVQFFRSLELQEWNTTVSQSFILSLLGAFCRHFLGENKAFVGPKDIAAIIASLGPLYKAAVPNLADLLQDRI